MNIRIASGPIERFLRSRGFAAITLPPWGVFVLAERLGDTGLLAHEAVHWEQYKERGVFGFYGWYLWNQAKYGYKDNPAEREARDKSGTA